MHVHRREDEVFHIVEGRFRVWCGDRTWDVGPGGVAFLPRGVPRTFRNAGPGVGRLLTTVVPGGFEGFFLLAARRGLAVPGAMPALQRLAASFGSSSWARSPGPADGAGSGHRGESRKTLARRRPRGRAGAGGRVVAASGARCPASSSASLTSAPRAPRRLAGGTSGTFSRAAPRPPPTTIGHRSGCSGSRTWAPRPGRAPPAGAMRQRPCSGVPSRAAKQAALSKRGRQSQSSEPSRPTSAAVSPSPIRA
jgi:Cupin domain